MSINSDLGARVIEFDRQREQERGRSVVLDPSDPARCAREIVTACFTDSLGRRLLHRHRGSFWQFHGTFYRPADDEFVRTAVWEFLENAKKVGHGADAPKPGENLVCLLQELLQVDRHRKRLAQIHSDKMEKALVIEAHMGLEGKNVGVRELARLVNVDPSTVSAWKKSADYKALVREAKSQLSFIRKNESKND